jgi:hypothetical protein
VVYRTFGCPADGDNPVDGDGSGTVTEHKIARHVENLVDRVTLRPRHTAIIDEKVYYAKIETESTV